MRVRLEVSHERVNVQQVVLRADTLIGRSADCNLRILSTEVSRRHCRIILCGDAVFVRDLGSSNGTFIDGMQLEPEVDVAIAPGSQLSVAGVKFIVHFEPAARKPAASPLDSTVDYKPREKTDSPREQRDTPQPRPLARRSARDTVPNHPGETLRDGSSRPWGGAVSPPRPPISEPVTEILEGLPPASAGSDDEATVLDFLPDWDVDTRSASRPGARGG